MKDDKLREPLPIVYLGPLAGLSPSRAPNSGTGHSAPPEAFQQREPKK